MLPPSSSESLSSSSEGASRAVFCGLALLEGGLSPLSHAVDGPASGDPEGVSLQ